VDQSPLHDVPDLMMALKRVRYHPSASSLLLYDMIGVGRYERHIDVSIDTDSELRDGRFCAPIEILIRITQEAFSVLDFNSRRHTMALFRFPPSCWNYILTL
jgi:hypothetical protein